MSYDGLYQLTKFLSPYLVINEKPYNTDDNIQYYSRDDGKWFKGKILKYSSTNSYDIKIDDDDWRKDISNKLTDINAIDLDLYLIKHRIHCLK